MSSKSKIYIHSTLGPSECSFLTILLRSVEIYGTRAPEIKGSAHLDLEEVTLDGVPKPTIVISFTVADDPQPISDMWGEPEKISLRISLEELHIHPDGPILHYTCQPTSSKSGRKYWLESLVCESPMRIYIGW